MAAYRHLTIALLLGASFACAPGLFAQQAGKSVDELRAKLSEVEQTRGPNHPSVALGLRNLAIAYETQGRYADSEPLLKQALTITEKAFGPEHLNTAAILHSLAGVYTKLGDYQQAQILYNRELAIREKNNGTDQPAMAAGLNMLAITYKAQARYADAESLLKRALAINEKVNGPDHPATANNLGYLAGIYQIQGRASEAEALLKRTQAIREKTYGPEHPSVATNLDALTSLYRSQARLGEAETLAKRALAIREKAFGADHPATAASINKLGTVYWDQGRHTDLEALTKRALGITEKSLGAEHPRTATLLNNLGDVYRAQGRLEEAEQLYKKALAITEKFQGAEHPDMAIRLSSLGTIYGQQHRYGDAESMVRRALNIRENAFGRNHAETAKSLATLASLLAEQGRDSEAEPFYRRALTICEKNLTSTHPTTAGTLSALGALLQRQKKDTEAKLLLHRALGIMASRQNSNESGNSISEQPRNKLYLPYLALLARQGILSDDEGADALTAVQLARRSDTAEAFADLAQRLAAGGSGELARRVRDRQELAKQLKIAEKRLLDAYSNDQDEEAENTSALRSQVDRLQGEYRRATQELNEKFPAFAEFEGNHVANLANLQKTLLPKEALLGWILGKKESYLLLVRAQEQPKLLPLAIDQQAVTEEVLALRSTLALDDKATVAPFPAVRAANLFASLFGNSWEKDLAGVEHVFLIPEGALTRLPFSVLLTAMPADATFPGDGTQYQQAPWLIRRFGMSVLPSISSLTALRNLESSDKAQLPFLGIGDPLLKNHPSISGQVSKIASTRSFRRSASGMVETRGMDRASLIRSQPSLPDTADELAHMANVLHANGRDALLLRDKATESIVKHTPLDKYAVLSFATHGVLAGQMGKGVEAGLILTPPTEASEDDDGYLTVSEIAKLRINADWVILSACNTAGGSGEEAEGLSGLAKAFSYAGAKALFVSHWAVDSEATTKLTGHMFREILEKKLSRAEAHRQAMLAMLRDQDKTLAHPSLWAPFIVVGDGGRRPDFLR